MLNFPRQTFFSLLVCVLVVCLPWAVGLNRPWAWGGFCVATFGAVCVHLGLFKQCFFAATFKWPLLAFGVFMAWAVCQMVPGFSGHEVWQLAQQTLEMPGASAEKLSIIATTSVLPTTNLSTATVAVAKTISFNPQPALLLLLLAYAACVWLGAQVARPKWLVASVVATVFAASVLACWALVFPQGTWWNIMRHDYLRDATLPFLNRNAMAAYVGMGLVLAVSYAPRFMAMPRPGQKKRVYLNDTFPKTAAYGALLAFLALTLFLTHSRAGVACTGLALALLWWLRGWRHKWLLLLGLFGAGAVALLMPILSDRMALLPEDFARRVTIWQASWQVAQACFPAGCGLGSFTEAYRLLGDATGSFRTIDKAHNVALHLLVTMGAAAVLLPVMFVPLLATLLPKKGFRTEPLGAAVLAISVLLLMHNLVDFSLHMPAIMATFLLLLGAALRHKLCNKTAPLGKQPKDTRKKGRT